jgi:hypothetical protein
MRIRNDLPLNEIHRNRFQTIVCETQFLFFATLEKLLATNSQTKTASLQFGRLFISYSVDALR